MNKKEGARKRKKGTGGAVKSPALSGAIRDLENELSRLKKEKNEVKRQIENTSSTIDVDREKEKELQSKIAALVEKEAQLNAKKKNLQTKAEKISDKVGKISKIKSEMSDI